MKRSSYLKFVVLYLLVSCLQDVKISPPNISCETLTLESNTTFEYVKNKAGFGIQEISEDLILEAYVISSDEFGSFYKTLIVQDAYENPSCGFRIAIDLQYYYAKFPIGRKVFLKLKGLAIAYHRGNIEIGKVSGAALTRIPNSEISKHIIRTCEQEVVVPKNITKGEWSDSDFNQMISVENTQFQQMSNGATFGNSENTNTVQHLLEVFTGSCEFASEFNLQISGFSSFKNNELPLGNGTIQGILQKNYQENYLEINSLVDVSFLSNRCVKNEVTIANIQIADLKKIYHGERFEFGLDSLYVVEGYVVSTDAYGNFKNRLILQDDLINPTAGVQFLLERESLFEAFPVGCQVLVNLNKLYLDVIDGVFTVGFPTKTSVTDIPQENIYEFLQFKKEPLEVKPKAIDYSPQNFEAQLGTLVEISMVQLVGDQVGSAYTYFSSDLDGERTIESCDVHMKINVYTEGSAVFANQQFPKGNGKIRGILFEKNGQPYIMVRNETDVDFQNARITCERIQPKIIFTEIADPENSVGARFIELYNLGEESVDFTGWQLNKYVNGSGVVSAGGLSLSGLVIEPKGFVVIANSDFETIFQLKPSLMSNYITGNGDDCYALIDAVGSIHDVYGIPNIDGTATLWDYQDGKAIRKKNVSNPNPEFDISEWTVFSKGVDEEQIAPANFTPFDWKY